MKQVFVFLFPFLLTSCAHHHLYSGRIKALDNENQEREVLVYWTKTDHFLRKNENAGNAMKVKTQCSSRTLNYIENEQGLHFLNTDQTHVAVVGESPTNLCGEVLHHKKLNHIGEGPLEITVLCQAQASPLTLRAAKRYIKARTKPYKFEIKKSKIEPGFIPNVAACNE